MGGSAASNHLGLGETIGLCDDTFGFPGAGVDPAGDIGRLLGREVQCLHDLEYGRAIGLVQNNASFVMTAWNTFAQQRIELDAPALENNLC
jgi:hypothetical protein